MSTAATKSNAQGSPLLKARLAGVFYVLNIVTGASALVFNGRGMDPLGDAASLAASACYVVVTLLLYGLFVPVSKRLSLVAALFSLAGCAVGALSTLHLARSPINPLAFFGVYCIMIGVLIFRSTFLPRFLGVLMAFGGLGWLTFLSPPLARQLSPYNMAPGILVETVLTLWLLVAGVNVQRWKEQAQEGGS